MVDIVFSIAQIHHRRYINKKNCIHLVFLFLFSKHLYTAHPFNSLILVIINQC